MFFQQLINGLTLGATYSLVAIGYTLIFGVIGIVHFAHGEVLEDINRLRNWQKSFRILLKKRLLPISIQ